jgi:branched-chain amino acid transport system substrate-binding protein
VKLRLLVVAVVATLASTPMTGAHAADSNTADATRPIRIMTIGDFQTGQTRNAIWTSAIRSRFEATALLGGVPDARGVRHHVDVMVCNTAFDPTRAEACARRAVRRSVAAVVGMSTVDSEKVWPILERAGIPVIGTHVSSAQDATSPMSFPIGSGIPGVYTGMPQLLAGSGATRLGVIITDFGDATDRLLSFVQNGMSRTAAALRVVVRVPIQGGNLRSAVAEAIDADVDGLIGFVVGERGSLLDELAAAGYAGSYVTQAPFGVGALGSDPLTTQRALLVGEFSAVGSPTPGMARFRRDLDESADGAELTRTEGAVNAWTSAWLFERIVRGLQRVDPSTVLAALRSLDHTDMGGITPPLTTTTIKLTALPRLFNPTVAFTSTSAGVVTPVTADFVDPFSGTPVSSR